MSNAQSPAMLTAHHLHASSNQIDFDLTDPQFPPEPAKAAPNKLVLLWRRNVRISVSPGLCRDHLANERTALGYIRTAQAWAMLGVITAQCMRLLKRTNPDQVLGFYVASIPLSAMCHCMALLTAVIGCARFLHWQSAMARGKAISAGVEIMTVFGLTFAILLSLLVLVIAISIRRDDSAD